MTFFIVEVGHGASSAELGAQLAHWGKNAPGVEGVPRLWQSPGGRISCAFLAKSSQNAHNGLYFGPGGVALSIGTPIVWEDDCSPSPYHLPQRSRGSVDWPLSSLDGRFALVNVDQDAVEVCVDPLGLQAIYTTSEGGIVRFSNVAPLLRRGAAADLEPRAMAAFLMVGASITEESLFTGVSRLPAGTVMRVSRDGTHKSSQANRFSHEEISHRGGRPLAEVLSAVCGAYTSLPDQSVRLALTGGLDSRLVAAAMTRTGFAFDTETLVFEGEDGYPLSADADVAAEVADVLGLRHRIHTLRVDPGPGHGWARMLESLMALSPGTVSMFDLQPMALQEGLNAPGAFLFDGVGGEAGRGGFDYQNGRAANLDGYRNARDSVTLAQGLSRRLLAGGRGGLAAGHFRPLLVERMDELSQGHLDRGVPPALIPEFVFLDLMGTWFGVKCSLFDLMHCAISPLLSRRVLAALLAPPLQERLRGEGHATALRALDGRLSTIPSVGRRGLRWPKGHSRLERGRSTVSRASDSRPSTGEPASMVQGLQAWLLSREEELWASSWGGVLDAERVCELLHGDLAHARRADTQDLWRLATAAAHSTRLNNTEGVTRCRNAGASSSRS